MSLSRIQIDLTTDGSGNASVTRTLQAGRLEAVAIAAGETLDATADVTIIDVATGKVLLTLTNTNGAKLHYPRVLVQDNVGADISGQYTAQMITGSVTVAIAQGGATKAATVYLVVER